MKKRDLILFLGLFLALVAPVRSQTLTSGFSATNIESGWNLPVGVAFNKTGDQLFVWEKGGKVFVNRWNVALKKYDKQTTPVIDITPEVGNWRDMGLLGFALDPHFEQNGYIYLMYCVDRHHLMYFGTPGYSETADDYLSATIGRITRYTTYVNTIGQLVADLSTRKILLGESKSTGIPILHESHGVGSLVFAMDGTLLASTGDASSYILADIGSDPDTYFAQGLVDSIIRPNENVGVYRSQMLNSHSGKILRIDPATGDGIASNPYFDVQAPRSAQSRMWAMGFRNPFRFSIRPNSGSVDPAIGDVGELFISDVGFNTYEEVTVVRSPGTNCGWPLYEGLVFDNYGDISIENKDEPNPLFGTGGCTQPYFTFQQLLRQANARGSDTVFNPCAPSTPITSPNRNRFLHRYPMLEWQHGYDTARVGIFAGDSLIAAAIGTPESKVTGVPFRGNASTGSVWYTGSMFPPSYKNTLFICDFGANWIKNLKVDYLEKVKQVDNFAFDFTGIIDMVESPMDGSIFCVDIGAQAIKRIAYVNNQAPVARVSADRTYGTSPLTVSLNGSRSVDPEGSRLTYAWDFGDGAPPDTNANPVHVFSAADGLPLKFVIRLTVRDNEMDQATDSIIVSVNNTPPQVEIVSPQRNIFYTVGTDTAYTLFADVTDKEHAPDQLTYRWQTILRHNNHEHPGPSDTNRTTRSVISRVGCNGEPFHWLINLAVTDAHGLTTYDSVKLFPACATAVPVITVQPASIQVCEGAAVHLQSATSDYYVLPVQWQVSKDSGISWTDLPGAVNASLNRLAVQSDSGNRYRAVWRNNVGTVFTQAAILQVEKRPPPPSGLDTLKFCVAATVSDLDAKGSALLWYSTAAGGEALIPHTKLVNRNMYYATQVINGCESLGRLPVSVLVNDAVNPYIVLDGSNSSGIPSRYQWEFLSGPGIPFIDSPASISTTVRHLAAGTYRFRLSLDSSDMTADVSILVNASDSILHAHAGHDRILQLPNNMIRLNGSASTGDSLSFHWEALSVNGQKMPILATSNAVATWVSELQEGVYAFELTVRDRSGDIRKDTVQVRVIPVSSNGNKPVVQATATAVGRNGMAECDLKELPTGTMLVLSLAESNIQYTVFQPDQVNQPDPTIKYSDGTPIELGMKFISAEDGYVTGVRFFKPSGASGLHIGELYTADGIRLAQDTFFNETAAGWQQLRFRQPVYVQKNTTYVVAYFSEGGYYSAAPNFFNASVVTPPLTALANGIDGSNGLYAYVNQPSFPVNSYMKSNYWVDVVFTTAAPVITSEPALKWVKRAIASGQSPSGNAAIYSALFPRGGDVRVNAGWGKGSLSVSLYGITQFDNLQDGTTADTVRSDTAAITMLPHRTNSLLIGVAADKKAVAGEERVYYDSTLETFYDHVPGLYSGYHFRKGAVPLSPQQMGVSSPSAMAASIVGFEVMGLRQDLVVADAGYNQRVLLPIPPEGQPVQMFCGEARIRNLAAKGYNVRWFSSDTGMQVLDHEQWVGDSIRYYASQEVDGCQSRLRLPVLARVTPVPPPPDIAVKDNCDSSYTFSVIPCGDILWNTGDTGTSVTARTSDTFSVSRKVMGCLSATAQVVRKPVLLVLDAGVVQPLCVEDKGRVTLMPTGGAGEYVFNATPTEDLPAGTYLYQVTDSNRCTKQVEIVIGIDQNSWTGVIDDDWHHAGNWSKGLIPTARTHVIIPPTQRQCVVRSADAVAASIQTSGGGAILVENNRKVLVSGKCLSLPEVK